jgi:pantothenate kinase-related protein Tda10
VGRAREETRRLRMDSFYLTTGESELFRYVRLLIDTRGTTGLGDPEIEIKVLG